MSATCNQFATASTPQFSIEGAIIGAVLDAHCQAVVVNGRTMTFSVLESQWFVFNMCKFFALKSSVATTARRHKEKG